VSWRREDIFAGQTSPVTSARHSHKPDRRLKVTIATARSLVCSVALLTALAPSSPLHAQLGVGTWVRKVPDSMPAMTMKVEACCNGGRRLSYHFDINGTETVLTLESPFDGSEADVLIAGKPSGETMAITRVDDHHMSNILKLNGKRSARRRPPSRPTARC
jgi:hypothetical protein